IRIAAPDVGSREQACVAEAVASGWLSSRGPFVARFEQAFASFCGTSHGVACASGTTALHLALAALRIGPGDEVIVPALTMIGSVNPVRYVGATPVVVDVLEDVWTMSPARVKTALTPRTRAIVVTHLYGHPADVDAIRQAAPGIPIVEDAAEAHGATLRGRRAGSLGDIAAFSFYANKILTTGEGGMVVTSRADLAERCRSLRDHAFGGDESRYEHREVGFSYRMSNLQAAVGLAQTERALELVGKSRRVGERYRAGLRGVAGLEVQGESDGAVSAYWVFGLVVSESARVTRDQLRAALGTRGIETRDFFHPIHRQPAYAQLCGAAQCPVAERLGARGLYLPSGPGRTDAEVDTVIEAVKESI
ncbi:MAG: DegT/DnrJ/EryC1/StrS family aminotransferase, partial [Gemmatimonadales bacterium]